MNPALATFHAVQQQLIALLRPLAEEEIVVQFHPALSPLGWHLGHCVYIEAHWLAIAAPSAELHLLYAPRHSPKRTRGERLPAKAELLAWAGERQQRHRALLQHASHQPRPPLSRCDLPDFLLQHHAQHVETMRMAMAQRTARLPLNSAAGKRIRPCLPSADTVLLPAGEYRIGSGATGAYDNEQPPRHLRLNSVRLARRPVSNAEYLAFIETNGYRERRWWSEAGWRWRRMHAIRQPEHWRQDAAADWLQLTPHGASPLRGDDTLLGISHFEAQAYAAWAGGRLPHEYEWEAAAKLGLLQRIGRAWEWCSNRFHPYPGFRAYPYAEYSLPWFDGRHYVLRGASPYTLPHIRRPSFRNFYTADQRHIFAGCRLAFDA